VLHVAVPGRGEEGFRDLEARSLGTG
jgi:hypothetical protein